MLLPAGGRRTNTYVADAPRPPYCLPKTPVCKYPILQKLQFVNAISARILHSILLLLKTTPPPIPFPRTHHPLSLHRFTSLSLSSPTTPPPRNPSNSPVFRPSQSHFSVSGDHFDRVLFGPKDDTFRWNFASGGAVNDRIDGIIAEDRSPRRCVEMYNAKGIHAVTFVASVMDVLSFDLGKKLEERIERLANELASWLSDEGDRDRFLVFHTFSNTGWLAYGAILDNLKDRQDLLERIKGCVVDSGGDPNIDPKVWAAGFTTALLKKSSSATSEKEPNLIENWLLFAFEKLFSYLLNLPDVNQRLKRSFLAFQRISHPVLSFIYIAAKTKSFHFKQ